MRKIIYLIIPALLLMGCNSPKQVDITDMTPIDAEIECCYNYFMDTTNYRENSDGYGLTKDRNSKPTLSSIAATGFLLACYPVFVEQGLMDKDDAYNISSKTLDTVLRIQNDETSSRAGCLSHYVNMSTGKRFSNSEISTIDTAILACGAITAGEYFLGDVKTKSTEFWSNIDFNQYITRVKERDYISMGYNMEKSVILSPWDYYAEQLMIYILGVGNPNTDHRISRTFYKTFAKNKGSYGGYEFVYSWFGSLFTYQYSQAFFNFKLYDDYRGINYFENSVLASKAAYQYCQDNAYKYKTFSESSWGLTACDIPGDRYSGTLGTPPRGYNPDDPNNPDTTYHTIEGTVAPTAAVSSMPFTPLESYKALTYFQSLPKLNDVKYGLKDSFNLDFAGAEWYAEDYIGIDKGIEVLQLYNYKKTDFISNLAMNNPYVIRGFIDNGFVEVTNDIQE